MTNDTSSPEPPRRWRWVAAGAVLLGGAAVWGALWFLGGDAPEEADLGATISSVVGGAETTAAAPPDGATDSTAGGGDTAAGIEGTWTVDPGIGEFTVEDGTTATFAGFRIDEELRGIGSTVAVGRTPGVTGSVTIEGTTLTAAELTVDMTAIDSNEERRERPIQQALGTGTNPEATFVLAAPVELGEGAASGDPVEVTVTGVLTINGVTNPVTIPLEAQIVEDMILVVGSTDIVFADYDVSVPSAPVVLAVEDHGVVEVQIWLAR